MKALKAAGKVVAATASLGDKLHQDMIERLFKPEKCSFVEMKHVNALSGPINFLPVTVPLALGEKGSITRLREKAKEHALGLVNSRTDRAVLILDKTPRTMWMMFDEAEKKDKVRFLDSSDKDAVDLIQNLQLDPPNRVIDIFITSEKLAVGLNLFKTCAVIILEEPEDLMTFHQIAGRSNRVDHTAEKDVHLVTANQTFSYQSMVHKLGINLQQSHWAAQAFKKEKEDPKTEKVSTIKAAKQPAAEAK